jgi:hypothetical protein
MWLPESFGLFLLGDLSMKPTLVSLTEW